MVAARSFATGPISAHLAKSNGIKRSPLLLHFLSQNLRTERTGIVSVMCRERLKSLRLQRIAASLKEDFLSSVVSAEAPRGSAPSVKIAPCEMGFSNVCARTSPILRATV